MPHTERLKIPVEMIERYREVERKFGKNPSTCVIGSDPELYRWLMDHGVDMDAFRDALTVRAA